ncbi:MBL fold metallo-hydrolase [Tannerella forsythia]|uniref:MBL fold metallo-hydrolase n=1 Tax=Tannerella forsythia TaxID=28112 RepID=A0A3P1Z0X2_TANFO|nr:MBL fold metallo-hydrolase [Tannerella forsythia]RRD76981.1 MBL fold metallo-hydrolase [Tannerella forsythia]
MKTSVRLIPTGYFYADGGCMFGATPQSAWKRRYKADSQNRCRLAMHVGLVTTECGRVILIDNGIGNKHTDQLRASFYQFHELTDLDEALRQYGIRPDDVTDVVLTHLHFDHCGGTTRHGEDQQIVPAYPNATCWVSEAQWHEGFHPNALERDSFFPENMEVIRESGKLRLIKDEMFLTPQVKLRLFGGHTCGQIVVDVRTDSRTVVFAGDVIPTSAHLSPTWISAYDIRPLETYHAKIRLLEEAAAKEQIVVYYHDAYTPYSAVKKINDFYKAISFAVDTDGKIG